MENYNKLIDLCEGILTIAYETDNNKLEQLAHELKATIEIERDPEEVISPITREKIEKVLDKSWKCNKNEEGLYELDIYADYRDEMDNKTATEILSSKFPMDTFYEKINYWYMDSEMYAISDLEKDITDAYPDEKFDEDELREMLYEMVQINYPYNHFLKQEFCVNIMLDTGDGNYDYTLNAHHPCWYGNRQGEPIDEKASLVWLAKQQGYTKEQLEKALDEGDMANPKGLLQSIRVECANMTSHMQTLTFLVSMTLEQLIQLNEMIALQDKDGHKYDATKRPDCGTITLAKNTETGLYDPWNGGGSVLEIQLEKDVEIPIKFIRSALPDGGDGYSICGVYGLISSAWRDTVKQIKEA